MSLWSLIIKARPLHTHCILTGFSFNAAASTAASHTESQRPRGHQVTTAVLRTVIRETHCRKTAYNDYRRFWEAPTEITGYNELHVCRLQCRL